MMALKLNNLLPLFLGCLALVNGSAVEFLRDPKSRCPKYWVDATHVDMVRTFLKLSLIVYYFYIYWSNNIILFPVTLRDVFNSTLINQCLGTTLKVSVPRKMPIW